MTITTMLLAAAVVGSAGLSAADAASSSQSIARRAGADTLAVAQTHPDVPNAHSSKSKPAGVAGNNRAESASGSNRPGQHGHRRRRAG